MSPQSNGQPDDFIDGADPQIVFAQHQRWLRTVVIARTGNSDAVDEILQEIALAFFGSGSRPSKLDGIAPWLYRVAVRQVMLLRRKDGRRRKLADHSLEELPSADLDSRTPEPLDRLLCTERRNRVQQALQDLHQKDREILMLKYTENWTYRELAANLGVSVAAVEARLHRARGRLRTALVRLQLLELP